MRSDFRSSGEKFEGDMMIVKICGLKKVVDVVVVVDNGVDMIGFVFVKSKC